MRIEWLYCFIKRAILRYILLFFTCFVFLNGYSQTKEFENVVIEPYLNSNIYLTEYFYTQLNKSNYFPGETIWFQLYILDKKNQKFIDLTKKVFTELFDTNGKLIKRKILQVKDGVTSNFFKVPPEYNHNRLYLRVYTQWSKNFDIPFFKEIRINAKSSSVKSSFQDSLPRIKFFPESVNFIEGVPTRRGESAR